MNKLFPALFLILTILSACRKDNNIIEPTDNGKKYNVSFTTVRTAKSASIPTTLGETKPEYTRIYSLDAGGQLVSTSQTNNELKAGNYVAVFIYSNTWFSRVYGLGGVSEPTNFNDAFFDTRLSVETQSGSIENIYYKKVNFKVNKNDYSQNVELDRLVADLEVVLQGGIPNNVSVDKYELVVNDVAIFRFNNDSRESAANKIKTFSPQSTVLKSYVLGQGPRVVTVRAYDSAGKVIKEKRLSGIFVPGEKTVLNLDLFSDTSPLAIVSN
jgi:hypothetical protein